MLPVRANGWPPLGAGPCRGPAGRRRLPCYLLGHLLGSPHLLGHLLGNPHLLGKSHLLGHLLGSPAAKIFSALRAARRRRAQ